jgi:hypothetical protein
MKRRSYQTSGSFLNFTTTSSGDYFYVPGAPVSIVNEQTYVQEVRPVVLEIRGNKRDRNSKKIAQRKR